jgi:hypothetical protein
VHVVVVVVVVVVDVNAIVSPLLSSLHVLVLVRIAQRSPSARTR